jgi:hypothetical protein
VQKRKFLEQCARRSNATVEEIERDFTITRCECGKKHCPGWLATYRVGWRKRQPA